MIESFWTVFSMSDSSSSSSQLQLLALGLGPRPWTLGPGPWTACFCKDRPCNVTGIPEQRLLEIGHACSLHHSQGPGARAGSNWTSGLPNIIWIHRDSRHHAQKPYEFLWLLSMIIEKPLNSYGFCSLGVVQDFHRRLYEGVKQQKEFTGFPSRAQRDPQTSRDSLLLLQGFFICFH